eukprot:344297-Rhodomonas_salina.1
MHYPIPRTVLVVRGSPGAVDRVRGAGRAGCVEGLELELSCLESARQLGHPLLCCPHLLLMLRLHPPLLPDPRLAAAPRVRVRAACAGRAGRGREGLVCARARRSAHPHAPRQLSVGLPEPRVASAELCVVQGLGQLLAGAARRPDRVWLEHHAPAFHNAPALVSRPRQARRWPLDRRRGRRRDGRPSLLLRRGRD